MEPGTKYKVSTQIARRRHFTAKFVFENESGFFFDTGAGEIHIPRGEWVKMRVKEVIPSGNESESNGD